jgi:hypothetical protein
MALPWSFVSKITNSKHQIPNKSQIPSTKFQINPPQAGKSQIPNRFKAIVFLFGILNFGHCYLFVFWDLLFEISIGQ